VCVYVYTVYTLEADHLKHLFLVLSPTVLV
jgi:hypothetical protein